MWSSFFGAPSLLKSALVLVVSFVAAQTVSAQTTRIAFDELPNNVIVNDQYLNQYGVRFQVVDELDAKIKSYLEKTLPGWKYERVEPLRNSPDVLVQFWSSANRKVKISVMPYNSVQEAQEVFKNHKRYSLNKEPLDSVADDALASGYGSSDVAFRKGKYNVYISTTADVESDPDARSLTQAQIFEREKSERRRWGRELAKHVANALTGP